MSWICRNFCHSELNKADELAFKDLKRENNKDQVTNNNNYTEDIIDDSVDKISKKKIKSENISPSEKNDIESKQITKDYITRNGTLNIEKDINYEIKNEDKILNSIEDNLPKHTKSSSLDPEDSLLENTKIIISSENSDALKELNAFNNQEKLEIEKIVDFNILKLININTDHKNSKNSSIYIMNNSEKLSNEFKNNTLIKNYNIKSRNLEKKENIKEKNYPLNTQNNLYSINTLKIVDNLIENEKENLVGSRFINLSLERSIDEEIINSDDKNKKDINFIIERPVKISIFGLGKQNTQTQDDKSCSHCEQVYKDSVINNIPLLSVKCPFCDNIFNQLSLDFYVDKYKQEILESKRNLIKTQSRFYTNKIDVIDKRIFVNNTNTNDNLPIKIQDQIDINKNKPDFESVRSTTIENMNDKITTLNDEIMKDLKKKQPKEETGIKIKKNSPYEINKKFKKTSSPVQWDNYFEIYNLSTRKIKDKINFQKKNLNEKSTEIFLKKIKTYTESINLTTSDVSNRASSTKIKFESKNRMTTSRSLKPVASTTNLCLKSLTKAALKSSVCTINKPSTTSMLKPTFKVLINPTKQDFSKSLSNR